MSYKNPFCRCCMSAQNLRNISNSFEDGGKMAVYSEVIYSCLGVDVLRGVESATHFICERCVIRLKDVASFRRQIVAIQTLLLSTVGESLQIKSHNTGPKKEEEEYGFPDDDNSNGDTDIKPIKVETSIVKKIENTLKLINSKQVRKLIPKKVTAAKPNNPTTVTKVVTIRPFVKSQKKPNRNFRPYELDKETLTCKMCKEKFFSLKTLDYHMNVHFPNYICDVCGKGFVNELRLKRHSMCHEVGEYKCSICNEMFTNKNKLNTHKQLRHIPDRLVFACPKCPQRFKSYYARIVHLTNIHNENNPKHKCEFCDMSFPLSCRLKTHIRMVHWKVKNHMCDQCGMGFYTKSCLRNHSMKHTGLRGHTCEICNKSYFRKYTLREHMRIHNNDKRFTCTDCGRSFTQKCTLKGHMKIHLKTGEVDDTQCVLDTNSSVEFNV